MELERKYNMLKCIKYVGKDKRGKKYLFKCDCGNEVIYHGTYVKISKYKSCGCMKYSKNKDSEIMKTKYFRLQPIKRVNNIHGGKAFLCKCDCGAEKIVALSELKKEKTKSCGCLNSEVQSKFMKKYNTKHGHVHSEEYSVWKGMKARCFNKNFISYKNYGGRGITVCERWKDSFINFYNDMGKRPSKNHQIDRIDNNGNYEPSNCRWVTRSENCLNRRHKIGVSGYRNIILDNRCKSNNCYYAMIKRKGKVRTSKYTTLNNALKIRDRWLQEYENDPNIWLKRTITKSYKKAI